MARTSAALLLLALLPAPLAAAQTYAVLQYESFWPQVSVAAPTQPSTCFVFTSAYTNCAAEDIEVTMTNPTLFQFALTEATDSPDGNGRRRFEAFFDSTTESGLMGDNPSGQYLYDIFTPTDPLCADTLTFNQPFPAGGGGWPSRVPALSGPSFSALSSVDATQPLTLTFPAYTPFAGATSARTYVYIQTAQQTLAFDSDLPNTATTVTIPANTLQPGTPYTLLFRYFSERQQTVNFRDHSLSFGRTGFAYFTTLPASSCTPSDVAGPNQSIGPDGNLTADDIIVFLGWFFAADDRADVAGPNQSTTPDNAFTADDIIVFLSRYFAGC